MDGAIGRAHEEALKSVEQFRLGAALLCGRDVVAAGRNRNANSCGLASIHAEMDAMWKAPKSENFKDAHLVVVRVLGDGTTTGCSRPCDACARALARAGIRKVTYTTGDPRHPMATASPVRDRRHRHTSSK